MERAERRPVLGFGSYVRDTVRLLFFIAKGEEMRSYPKTHLFWGLLATWVAGYGRTWDDEAAEPLRRTGLGSVVYVFVLALFLWAFIRPFDLYAEGYRKFLTFVTLVSPLAFFYAIPVERWAAAEQATNLNAIFLLIVAAWRVALLLFYAIRGLEIRVGKAILAVFTPLSIIIALLGAASVLYAIGNMMGGIRSQQDRLIDIFSRIGCFSMVMAPVLLFGYLDVLAKRDD